MLKKLSGLKLKVLAYGLRKSPRDTRTISRFLRAGIFFYYSVGMLANSAIHVYNKNIPVDSSGKDR